MASRFAKYSLGCVENGVLISERINIAEVDDRKGLPTVLGSFKRDTYSSYKFIFGLM